jgi:hypothetical protein
VATNYAEHVIVPGPELQGRQAVPPVFKIKLVVQAEQAADDVQEMQPVLQAEQEVGGLAFPKNPAGQL